MQKFRLMNMYWLSAVLVTILLFSNTMAIFAQEEPVGDADLNVSSARAVSSSEVSYPTDTLFALASLSLGGNLVDGEVVERGLLDEEAHAHPLNPLNITNSALASTVQSANTADTMASVLGYSAIYNTEIGLHEGRILLASYIYEYPSSTEAGNVADILIENWHSTLSNFESVEVLEYEGLETGKVLAYILETGEIFYWAALVRENTMTLLVANGQEKLSVADAFNTGLHELQQKSEAKSVSHRVFLPLVSGNSRNEVIAAEVQGGMWRTSDFIHIAFWAHHESCVQPWCPTYPHRSAVFSGRNGRYQYYTGPYATPGGFGGWTWHPNPGLRNELLISTSWWASHPGGTSSQYFHAWLDCPC